MVITSDEIRCTTRAKQTNKAPVKTEIFSLSLPQTNGIPMSFLDRAALLRRIDARSTGRKLSVFFTHDGRSHACCPLTLMTHNCCLRNSGVTRRLLEVDRWIQVDPCGSRQIPVDPGGSQWESARNPVGSVQNIWIKSGLVHLGNGRLYHGRSWESV